ncbi:MAG: DUF1573 domain-containing protein [Verrucomicrobiota bacterium]
MTLLNRINALIGGSFCFFWAHGCLAGENLPPFQLSSNVVEFGIVEESVVHAKSIELKNLTDETVEVSAVVSSCSCTDFKLSNKTMRPRSAITIRVEFTPQNRSGFAESQGLIQVERQGNKSLLPVTVSAWVAPPSGFKVDREVVHFGFVGDQPEMVKIRVYGEQADLPDASLPVETRGVRARVLKPVAFDPVSFPGLYQLDLEVSLNAKKNVGSSHTVLNFTGRKGEASVPVVWKTKAPLDTYPTAFYLGNLRNGSKPFQLKICGVEGLDIFLEKGLFEIYQKEFIQGTCLVIDGRIRKRGTQSEGLLNDRIVIYKKQKGEPVGYVPVAAYESSVAIEDLP